MTLTLTFCKAEKQDAEQIVALINSAYRGELSRKGWTTEADLLEGRRTDIEEIMRLIADDDSMFVLGKEDVKLQGTVHLQNTPDGVHIGMLAVNPMQQNQGIGKALLQAAEITARQTWTAQRFVMSVISLRQELIAFYQRRGYKRTGISREFPEYSPLWTTRVSDLRLELLEKSWSEIMSD